MLNISCTPCIIQVQALTGLLKAFFSPPFLIFLLFHGAFFTALSQLSQCRNKVKNIYILTAEYEITLSIPHTSKYYILLHMFTYIFIFCMQAVRFVFSTYVVYSFHSSYFFSRCFYYYLFYYFCSAPCTHCCCSTDISQFGINTVYRSFYIAWLLLCNRNCCSWALSTYISACSAKCL